MKFPTRKTFALLAYLATEAALRPLIQLLPELRERFPEALAGQAEAQLGQTQLPEPLVRLMLALAGQAPLVLFPDDLQWADSATLETRHDAARRWREAGAPCLNAWVGRTCGRPYGELCAGAACVN